MDTSLASLLEVKDTEDEEEGEEEDEEDMLLFYEMFDFVVCCLLIDQCLYSVLTSTVVRIRLIFT